MNTNGTHKATWAQANRMGGLRRFALAISLFNIAGHTLLGFEQSLAQPLVALATAYSMEILLEMLDAWSKKRPTRFAGQGLIGWMDFLLSAHITGLAVAMLLYANERLWPIALAAAIAIGSKAIFRVSVGQGSRHYFNPSNLGIAATLLLFPWVGIAPPYMFSENLHGPGDWILPGFIILSGTFLNARFTKRLPLIGTWLSCFAFQALLRHWFFDASLTAALLPMTGVAFILFTFYMVTDPATTPTAPRSQIIFGASVAATYGLLMTAHVVFGLFFALCIVCIGRGVVLYAVAQRPVSQPTTVAAPAATTHAAPAIAKEA